MRLQQLNLPLKAVSVGGPATLLLIQLLAMLPGKAAEDGPSTGSLLPKWESRLEFPALAWLFVES